MYKFNTTLWINLPRLLGLGKMTFYEQIGTSNIPYNNVINHKDIRITKLVNICNQFHISMHSFIICENTPEIPTKLVIPLHEWKPISLHLNQLHQCYRQNIGGCTRNEFFKIINYTPTAYSLYVRNTNEPTLMLSNLLNVCNKWNFSPWKVIGDNNYQPTVEDLLKRIIEIENRVQILENNK